jgi:hypothetical protein
LNFEYSDLLMDQTDQTENNFTPSQIVDNNFQHNSTNNVDNVGTSVTNLAPQNITYEFYLPLPNEGRIYYVTYTELDTLEIARHLNNRIDLSHIPNNQFSRHYNIQSLIHQQFQQVQQPVNQQQQSFNNMTQVYSNYNDSNENITDNMQDTGYDEVRPVTENMLNPNNNNWFQC